VGGTALKPSKFNHITKYYQILDLVVFVLPLFFFFFLFRGAGGFGEFFASPRTEPWLLLSCHKANRFVEDTLSR